MGSGGGGGGQEPLPETEQERALAETTKGTWAHYTTDLRPLEDRWLADIRMDSGDKSMVASQTAAGIGSQYDKAQAETTGNMFAKNVDPSSGKFAGAMTGLGVSRGKATGAGVSRGVQAVDDATVQNLQSAVNVGRGQATEATADMGSIAGNAQREAISNADLRLRGDMADQERSEALAGTAASAAGFGLSKWQGGKLPDVSGKSKPAKAW
jgi:hypothetical protein